MKRTPFIVGNWKMNLNATEAKALVAGIHQHLRFPGNVDVAVAPPFTSIPSTILVLKDSYIDVGAQNLHHEEAGVFTGEISGKFLKEVGVNFVIIGHSERRQYFGETDELVGKKIRQALAHHLVPLVCVGETLEQRELEQHFVTTEMQITKALSGFSVHDLQSFVIAYEPVWAIGTGKTATTEQIDEMHAHLRAVLSRLFGTNFSLQTRILYGGSVTATNSKEILSRPDVDGALVGGASLKAEDFIRIVKSVA